MAPSFPRVSAVVHQTNEPPELTFGLGAFMFISAAIFLAWGLTPLGINLKPKWSTSFTAQKDFLALTAKFLDLSLSRTCSTFFIWS